jgi:hypothetical protein
MGEANPSLQHHGEKHCSRVRVTALSALHRHVLAIARKEYDIPLILRMDRHALAQQDTQKPLYGHKVSSLHIFS